MGCTYSAENRLNGIRSFRVYNVDDQGIELNRGTIEIRDNDLVLYQKGKDSIRWPLRNLRRYGFDAELFSFESGRRCDTGPGIYAFKCTHAESLFNLVQESLQRAGEEAQRGQARSLSQTVPSAGMPLNNPSRMPSSNGVTEVSAQTADRVFLFNGFNPDADDEMSERNGSSHLYVNGLVVEDTGHEYVNTTASRPSNGAFPIDAQAALVEFLHNPPGVKKGATCSQVNYAELCLPDPQPSINSMENLLDENGVGAIHNVERRNPSIDAFNRFSHNSSSAGGFSAESNYRNSLPVDLGNSSSQECFLQSSDSDVFLPGSNYVNLSGSQEKTSMPSQVNDEVVLPPAHNVLPTQARVAKAPLRARFSKQPPVNYITIVHSGQSNDILPGNNSPTSPTSCVSLPESPSRKTESYATIDFDRTVALSNATRPKDEDEEGVRKTRHNSTISDKP